MGPFLALITPIGGDGGGTPPVQPPLYPWGPTDPRPTLPIAGWNPGSGQFPPFVPPGGGQPPVYPSHPIYGNFPQHPIFYPPGTRPPGQGGPMPQPPIVVPPDGTWGPGDPRPTLPIAGWDPGTGNFPQPPGGGGGDGEHKPRFEKKIGWSEQTGWVVVFVPAEGTLVPTPSETEQPKE